MHTIYVNIFGIWYLDERPSTKCLLCFKNYLFINYIISPYQKYILRVCAKLHILNYY